MNTPFTHEVARAALALLLALAAFAVLVVGARLVSPEAASRQLPMDEAGFAFAAKWGAVTEHFFAVFTWLGSLWVLLPAATLIAVIHWRRESSLQAIFVPVALASASLLSWSTKWLVDRARPEAFTAAIDMPVDPSFPSGHTLQAVAFALAWTLCPGGALPRWMGLVVLVLALGVGVSRIVLRVHFTSDVLFAVLAALLWVGALRLLPFWNVRL